ncbi:MAG: D-2-hydroxyacid dehydrogenase [Tannerella sp.]|jgi:glycerate dehydrogenase|nr:D-2-hydroxyacid dehydrogenase [Tannerella sp.]
MKIVILDGYTLNPGDISWDGLKKFGDVTIHERTVAEQIIERAAGAEIVFTNKTPLSRETIGQLPGLKYIGVLATGYNVVDIAGAKDNDVIVTNIPGYGTDSVAQMTFALLLELCHHVQDHSDSVRQGRWAQSVDFCYWDYPLIELAGKTMGIIGFGTIGRKVADIATVFGMNVIGNDKFQSDQSHRKNFKWAEVNELLAESDVVSIHCPLFPETKGLIDRERLKLMKSTAFVINTARGPVIVDADLAEALNNGVIAGAGIDVLSVEPPTPDNPLFSAKNCLITPHISWATREARTRLMDIAVNNLAAFINGSAVNIVNP